MRETLKQMLSAEVDAALEQRPDLQVVELADGARDNWSYLRQLAPQAASSYEVGPLFMLPSSSRQRRRLRRE